MRSAQTTRITKETDITIKLNLDSRKVGEITTGLGFFDHMLTHISKHGFMQLDVCAKGDIEVDSHHTIEDIGIILGQLIKEAIGDKKGIKRYGSVILPMDETLVLCAIDLSGRSFLNFDAIFTVPKLGDVDTEMFEEFFRAVAFNAGMNLHIKVLDGSNNHHIAEGIFKAFGRALSDAVQYDNRVEGVLSTKGSLE